MRTFKKLMTVCAFFALLSTSTMANTLFGTPDKTTSQELRKEITELISSPDFKQMSEETVSVSFMVTRYKEIVVLNVSTDQAYLDNYIKEMLNYHDVKTEGALVNMPYQVNIKFTPI